MNKYDPKKIEPKWQQYWETNKTFEVTEDKDKKKFYSLVEFPYPSGAGLHVGHPRPYTAMDVISRKKRMEGYNVLFPIGFDAFGLPTENYAIKTGRPPAEVTAENIATFTRQLKSLGYSFDWSRTVDTTDPAYFKWTQWIFLQLYKAGLAYKKSQPINWCPKDKIGLANEEAAGGVCDRCGGPVEKRNKEQWMLAITKYADQLLEGLKEVDYIPQARLQQENWIGRSEGATIKFEIRISKSETKSQLPNISNSPLGPIGHSRFNCIRNVGRCATSNDCGGRGGLAFPSFQGGAQGEIVEVFTTRPDTIFGATFLAVSPELAKSWLDVGWQTSDEVKDYVTKILKERNVANASREEQEKTGVAAGVVAINPVSGEEIPVWITNYVLGDVGTGAIMAVPAHDERDFEFAKKFYLPIKQVVAPEITLTGNTAPRPGKEDTQRDVVTVIIRHAESAKYLFLKLTDGHTTFVGGGIDKGETAVAAALREIQEESGYTNIALNKTPVMYLYGHGYKAKKDINCNDFDTVFFADVLDDAQVPLSAEDQGAHEVLWLDEGEVIKALTKDHHRMMWDWYVKKTGCFTGEGKTINSPLLNGLTTKEAKSKIIQFLEEKNIGQHQVNFKLRDWVFSRQRYWGEPIPLVYCAACAQKKSKIIIIHGFGGYAEKNWFPWLKQELETKGFEVFVPNLPNSDQPDLAAWVAELEKLPLKESEPVMIVAHSLGAPTACKYISQANLKVRKLILVAPTFKSGDFSYLKEQDFTEDDIAILENFGEAGLNFSKIKNQIQETSIFLSEDDPLIPLRAQADYTELKPNVTIFKNKGHFSKNHGNVTILTEILTEFESGETLNPGWIPLPESELPLKLPDVEKYEPTDTGESPLATMTDWVNTKCPHCGGPAKRETDTMPNWAGSSWYFLAYLMQGISNFQFPISNYREVFEYWTPVDWYNGGNEHTVLHLLYSRFWNQFLYDQGHVPTREPYKKRTSHGIILAEDGEKMSKSRGNVINPDDMVDQFGADALRTYIMFMGPFDQAVAWSTNGLVGVRRFLDRVWNLQDKLIDQSSSPISNFQFPISKLHQTIKKITEDIDGMRFNTAIAKLMELVNTFSGETKVSKDHYEILIKLLSPFAPHLCEEAWQALGHRKGISLEQWPSYDPALTVADEMELAVQVNGKVRDTLKVSVGITEEAAKDLALASEKIKKWLDGKEPKKIIYVKGKLVSIVV